MASAPDPRMPDMPVDAERTRGRYVHLRRGGAAGTDERFVLGEVGERAVRVRSTRVSSTPASRLECDVRLADTGRTVALRWVASGDGVVRSATVDCAQVDGGVDVRRTVDGVAYDPVVVEGPLILPGLVLAGLVVPGSAHAFAVDDAGEPATFLLPRAVQVETEELGEEVVMIGGSDMAGTVVRWRLTGAIHGEGVDVVDAGLLLRRTSGDVVATLAELTGPWPRPLSWPASG